MYRNKLMLNVLKIMPSLERMFESWNFIHSVKSARVAQLVERQAFNLNVQGSSPCSGEFVFAIFDTFLLNPGLPVLFSYWNWQFLTLYYNNIVTIFFIFL